MPMISNTTNTAIQYTLSNWALLVYEEVLPRVSAYEYALGLGVPLTELVWCERSLDRFSLRARAGPDLFNLVPLDGGGWRIAYAGSSYESAAIDLRGLSAAEARGQQLTVWYEEEQERPAGSGTMVNVDVPYIGRVLGLHPREGLSAQFSTTFEGKPEVLSISDEDDWAWGARQVKPLRRGRIELFAEKEKEKAAK